MPKVGARHIDTLALDGNLEVCVLEDGLAQITHGQFQLQQFVI